MPGWFFKLLKRFHPEGIPWPGSVLYNALSGSAPFIEHYRLAAEHMATYGPAERILDIGTGPARLLPEMRKVFPEAELIGVDISEAMVELARRNLRKAGADARMSVQLAGAVELPFEGASFDRVVSTGSLHHWKDADAALAEIDRVLTPDGLAFICDLVRDVPKDVRRDAARRYGRFRYTLLWLHSFEEPFPNREEMAKLGRRSPLTVVGTPFLGAMCCLTLRKTNG